MVALIGQVSHGPEFFVAAAKFPLGRCGVPGHHLDQTSRGAHIAQWNRAPDSANSARQLAIAARASANRPA